MCSVRVFVFFFCLNRFWRRQGLEDNRRNVAALEDEVMMLKTSLQVYGRNSLTLLPTHQSLRSKHPFKYVYRRNPAVTLALLHTHQYRSRTNCRFFLFLFVHGNNNGGAPVWRQGLSGGGGG